MYPEKEIPPSEPKPKQEPGEAEPEPEPQKEPEKEPEHAAMYWELHRLSAVELKQFMVKHDLFL